MALQELSTNGKLDAVLKCLNNAYKEDKEKYPYATQYKYSGHRTKSQISIAVSFESSAEHIDELELILEHLTTIEHYISIKKNPNAGVPSYRILYAGKIFIESGGYNELEKTLNQKRKWEKEISEAGPKHAHRLNLLTAALILVGLIVLAWDIWKYCHPICN